MSTFSHFALQKAIFTLLNGDAMLSGLANGIYDRVPDDAEFPYVAIGNFFGSDWSTKSTNGMEYIISLHTWSREGGRAEAMQIMERIYSLLHDAGIMVEGQIAVLIRFLSSNVTLESDGWSYQGIMRFKVLLQAA